MKRGIKPHEFSDMTWPQMVNVLNEGRPRTSDFAWQAKRVLADIKSGKLAWRE